MSTNNLCSTKQIPTFSHQTRKPIAIQARNNVNNTAVSHKQIPTFPHQTRKLNVIQPRNGINKTTSVHKENTNSHQARKPTVIQSRNGINKTATSLKENTNSHHQARKPMVIQPRNGVIRTTTTTTTANRENANLLHHPRKPIVQPRNGISRTDTSNKENKNSLNQPLKPTVTLSHISTNTSPTLSHKEITNSDHQTQTHIETLESSTNTSPFIQRRCGRCQMLDERVQFLTNEVQSLKDVLELKDLELKSVKTKLQLADMRCQELESVEQTVISLTQRVEALEVAGNQKNSVIAVLKGENQTLKDNYDREQREKQKVLMKNEELEYSLSVVATPNKSCSNFSCQVDDTFVTPLKPEQNSRHRMSSVPAFRPSACASYRKRSCNTACKDLRKTTAFAEMNSHQIGTSFDFDSPTFVLPTCSSPPPSKSENTNERSIVDRRKERSSLKTDTFRTKEEELKNNKNTISSDNYDLLKSIPPHSPHSILDSGIEDIDGFISFK